MKQERIRVQRPSQLWRHGTTPIANRCSQHTSITARINIEHIPPQKDTQHSTNQYSQHTSIPAQTNTPHIPAKTNTEHIPAQMDTEHITAQTGTGRVQGACISGSATARLSGGRNSGLWVACSRTVGTSTHPHRHLHTHTRIYI